MFGLKFLRSLLVRKLVAKTMTQTFAKNSPFTLSLKSVKT